MPQKEQYRAFLLYADDWLSSTTIEMMSAAEERGYLRLLLHAWKSDDCGLPDDDAALALLSKLGADWQPKSGALLRSQFVARDGRLFNERLLTERAYQLGVRKSRSDAARKANEVRWRSVSDPSRIPNGCATDTINNPPSQPETDSLRVADASMIEKHGKIENNSQTESVTDPSRITDGSLSDPNSKLETKYSNRSEDSHMLITPERTERAKTEIAAHRRRGDQPDETIVRKILIRLEDDATLTAWLKSLADVDPGSITASGYGWYLSDVERWIANGCRRPARRKARKSSPPMKPFDISRITGKSPYFDTTTITGGSR